MKRTFLSVSCIFFFFTMLLHPQEVFEGAQNGLLLWFQIILPTLLPFMIVTNLLVHTSGLSYITQVISPILCPIFRVSTSGSFAIVAGFLCGYPLGAKITADLYRKKEISQNEAQYLLSFCNNTSPVFILNYIVWKTLNHQPFALPSLLILMLAPVLMSFLFRKLYKFSTIQIVDTERECKNVSWGLEVLDNCMMNSFEAIVKIGGYIMLFSILLVLLQNVPGLNTFYGKMFLSSLEITNGISLLASLSGPLEYISILTLTSFGGFCAAAQTQCMIANTPLKISHYIIEKLVTAMATSLFAFLYCCFF